MFQNNQWAVTSLGLESRPPAPPYRILAAELLSVRDDGDGPYYEWPVDLALKTWVDIETFVEAFVQAISDHVAQLPAAHNATLARTLARARSQAIGQPWLSAALSKAAFP